MPSFMTEEEAIAVIEKNIDKIEARMASGTQASSSQTNANNAGGGGTSPCDGTCDEFGLCCNCCIC